MNLVPFAAHASPALIAAGGQRASYRPFECLVSTTFEGHDAEAIFRGLK